MEKLSFNLHISSIEIGFPWFCVEEISFQIPKFVDRETNVRRKCSTVLRGKKKLAVFCHIFVVIGTTTLSIERRNLENKFQGYRTEDTWQPVFVSISTAYNIRHYIHEISATKHCDHYCHN